MKNQLHKEFQRLQKLAGIITENQNLNPDENNNPSITLSIGDQITSDMLKNPSNWEGEFPMEIVSFYNDGTWDIVKVKRILRKRNIFGKEKEIENVFSDLVYNWEKYELKPHVRMSPQM